MTQHDAMRYKDATGMPSPRIFYNDYAHPGIPKTTWVKCRQYSAPFLRRMFGLTRRARCLTLSLKFVMIVTEPEVCIDKAFLALMNYYANAWFTKQLQRTDANHFDYWCMYCTGCHWWYIWIKGPRRQCPDTCGTYILLILHTNTCSNHKIILLSLR